MPTTPRGRGTIRARAGRNHFVTAARRGRIQRRPDRNAPRIAVTDGKISAICVSIAGRPPKSSSIAFSISASLSRISLSKRRSRSARVGQSGKGARRCASRCDANSASRSVVPSSGFIGCPSCRGRGCGRNAESLSVSCTRAGSRRESDSVRDERAATFRSGASRGYNRPDGGREGTGLAVLVDTDTVASEDRAHYWRQALKTLFDARVHVEPAIEREFHGRLSIHRIDRVGVAELMSGPMSFSTTAVSGESDLIALVASKGAAVVEQGGRRCVLHERQIVLCSGSRPVDLALSVPARLASVHVPEDEFLDLFPQGREATLVPIAADE